MKKSIVLPGLILASVFLTGCVGLVVTHPSQKCTEQFCLGSRGVISNSPAATPLTEAKVLELWGEPDAKHTNQTMTVWQYQGKMGWTTVTPAYFVMLPIPIPAGHDQVELYFQDGIARKARWSVDVTTGVFIGPPGIVFALEKEAPDVLDGGVTVGCGFGTEDKPGNPN